ncbi:hypothetical protein QOT17_020679 [Balamuthia mandrillaris]
MSTKSEHPLRRLPPIKTTTTKRAEQSRAEEKRETEGSRTPDKPLLPLVSQVGVWIKRASLFVNNQGNNSPKEMESSATPTEVAVRAPPPPPQNSASDGAATTSSPETAQQEEGSSLSSPLQAPASRSKAHNKGQGPAGGGGRKWVTRKEKEQPSPPAAAPSPSSAATNNSAAAGGGEGKVPKSKLTLVIKNIPFQLSEGACFDFLSEHGTKPVTLHYLYDTTTGLFRGTAFVGYASEEACGSAFEALKGAELQGRKLRVEMKRQNGGNKTSSEKQQPENDAFRELQEKIEAFCADTEATALPFPPSLSNNQRRWLHQAADKLGLEHHSKGTGDERHIILTKPESQENNYRNGRRARSISARGRAGRMIPGGAVSGGGGGGGGGGRTSRSASVGGPSVEGTSPVESNTLWSPASRSPGSRKGTLTRDDDARKPRSSSRYIPKGPDGGKGFAKEYQACRSCSHPIFA